MRGGLDDALDKLARRDELRRRASGEASTGTPPAVTELVEAIAAVVSHNPELGVTVGVEGAGEPLLLHFYFAEGQVQVNAENAVVAQSADPVTAAPRHADFDIEVDEAVDEPQPGGEHRRSSQDDQDRFGQPRFAYGSQVPAVDERYYTESDSAERRYGTAEPDTAERRYGSFDAPPAEPDPRYTTHEAGESSRDLGARMRDLGMATREPSYQPHPFAATPPPPVPPQTAPTSSVPSSAMPASGAPTSGLPASAMPTAMHTQRLSPQPMPTQQAPAQQAAAQQAAAQQMPPQQAPAQRMPAPSMQAPSPPAQPMQAQPMPPQPRSPIPPQPDHAGATRRIQPEQHRAPVEPSAAERIPRPMPQQQVPHQQVPPQQQRSMPAPLPKPVPLQVERPEETEIAARRLAALLRDDPSLLDQPPG